MKVARTVLSGGKDGDNFKVLPIATTKKGPVVSNRTFPKMAKSNSYLTLPLYNTQNTYRCVEQEIPIRLF